MSRAAAKTQPASEPSREVSFENALKKLESIVEPMESEELPLETLLERYEEGARLVKQCQEKLAAAEVRIKALEKGMDGTFKLTEPQLEDENPIE